MSETSSPRAGHKRMALVTGAGRVIGRAIAVRLADAGAKVALVARTTAELNTTEQ